VHRSLDAELDGVIGFPHLKGLVIGQEGSDTPHHGEIEAQSAGGKQEMRSHGKYYHLRDLRDSS